MFVSELSKGAIVIWRVFPTVAVRFGFAPTRYEGVPALQPVALARRKYGSSKTSAMDIVRIDAWAVWHEEPTTMM